MSNKSQSPQPPSLGTRTDLSTWKEGDLLNQKQHAELQAFFDLMLSDQPALTATNDTPATETDTVVPIHLVASSSYLPGDQLGSAQSDGHWIIYHGWDATSHEQTTQATNLSEAKVGSDNANLHSAETVRPA